MKRSINDFGRIGIMILIGSWLSMISCGKENGLIVSESYELTSFDTLELNAVFNVEIIEGESYSLQIKGEQELTEDLSYTVENNRLRIDNKNIKLWMHPKNDPLLLTITCKGLTRIDVNETCNIKTLNTI